MRSVLYWIDNKQGFKNDQKLSKQDARSQKLYYSKLQTAMESAQQPKYPKSVMQCKQLVAAGRQ